MNRRLVPYLLTIIVFDIIYWLTMIIPNQALYMGFGKEWPEVIMNNKIPLHREIYTYLLAVASLGINLLEIITTKEDKFPLRIAKSISTIILTYLGAALIFKLLEVKTWNLFYYYRGVPANFFILATMLITFAGLAILEAIKRLYLFRFYKSVISKYIPGWLALEKK